MRNPGAQTPGIDLPSAPAGEIEQYLSSHYSQTEELASPEYTINPEILSSFRLDRADKEGFSLSIPAEALNPEEKREPVDLPKKELKDLYPFVAVSNPRLSRILGSSEPEGSSSRVHLPSMGRIGTADLSDWGKSALERIERNWRVDPYLQAKGKKVGIAVTIAREGQFIEIIVTQSSGDPVLDRSALEALKNSNPLPGLPSNFSQLELTLYLEFEYDD